MNAAMDQLIGPNLIPQILNAGYNFDFIDDAAIAKVGVPYKILVLPGVERMPLATVEKILTSGTTVIATRHRPTLAPGFREEGDTPKIRQLAAGLRVVTDETNLGEALHGALRPDVDLIRVEAFTGGPRFPAGIPVELGFVHRHLPDADIYFLVNTSNHAVRSRAIFRVSGMGVAWWDPVTGQISRAEVNAADLDLAPYESRVLVFSRLPAEAPASRTARAVMDLSSGWQVTFAGSREPVRMAALRSWTEEEGRRFFSGTATYERAVTLPDAARPTVLSFGEGTRVTTPERNTGSGMRALLDGPVREAAVVYVNGKRAGAVWCPPYQVDVSGFVHAGENTIRIVVANSALNVLAKRPLPDDKALIAKYGERFQAQDMDQVQPQPSGLLGQVRLIRR